MFRRWVDDRRRRCVRLHDSFGGCCGHRVYWNATKLLNWREVGRTNGVVVGGVVVVVGVVGEGVGPGVGNVAVVVGSVLVRAGAVDRGTAVLRYRVGSGSCSLVLMVLIVVGGVEVAHWIVATVGGRCVDGSAEDDGIVGGGGTVDDRVPGVVFWIEVRVGPRPAWWMRDLDQRKTATWKLAKTAKRCDV